MKKLLIPTLLILIAGCTKEVGYKTVTASADIENSTAAADTYLPLTTGTYWAYNNKTDNNNIQTSKLTVLGLKKTFKGKTYTGIQTLKGKNTHGDTIYYNKSGSNYYIYTNESIPDADKVNLEILYLKDNAAVNNTWNVSAGSVAGITLNCYGKIVEKNTSINVNGVTYKNVIHTYIEIRKPVFFFYIVVAKQHYYIAKNIGIVKNTIQQQLPSSSTTTSTITGYLIK